MSAPKRGDGAFRADRQDRAGRIDEMTYGGALSFLRRPYSRDITGGEIVVSGIPFDGAVTYRSGARLGPRAIRAASVQLAELHAFPFGFDPFVTLDVIDFGDCYLEPQYPETINAAIAAHAAHIVGAGGHMVTMGGDHSVSYALLKAHADVNGPLALVQLDAHSDTWPDDGRRADHGSMFLRAVREGLIDVERSVQIGIRTHNDSDFGFEILTAPFVHREGMTEVLDIVRERLGGGAAYLSVDIDVLDPAFAPGTGTPVPGGLSSAQLLEFIRGCKAFDFRGMDLVEVAPAYDHAEITALIAAHVMHDYICVQAERRGATRRPVGRP